MQRVDAGGGDSCGAAEASSGDSASHDDLILLSEHVSASAPPARGEGREEASEGAAAKKTVDNPMDGSETEKQEPHVMTDKREAPAAPAPESARRSMDEGTESGDQEFDNLVNLEATTETSPKQAVGSRGPAITVHTGGGLEGLGPASDAEEGNCLGEDEEKTDSGDRERGTDGSDKERWTDAGDMSGPPAEVTHEVPSHSLASADSPSPPRESRLRDDLPDLRLEARPHSPPSAGPEGAAGHTTPQSPGSTVAGEGVRHEVSSREASGEGKGYVISQPNEAAKDISSPAEADRDTSLCLVSPAPLRPADAPANHSSGMQKEAESRTENNKSGDEATLAREPFTRPSAPDAGRDLKGEEAHLAATDALIRESPEDSNTCEPPSTVPSGEENITEPQKHAEEAHDVKGDDQEHTKVLCGDEDADVTSLPVTSTPEPPLRPHRRTHHHNTPEALCPTVASPQIAKEAGGESVPVASVVDSSASVDSSVTSLGTPTIPEAGSHEGHAGWDASGSPQGHPDTHTPEGDWKERVMEEEREGKLPEDSASPPSLRKEVKETMEKEVEESVQTAKTLHSLLQQKEVVTLNTTTTTTTITTARETETEIVPPSRDRDEVHVENNKAISHHQRRPTQPPPLPPRSPIIHKLYRNATSPPTAPTVNHTVNKMDTVTPAHEASPSPHKPKRSSRSELRKQITSHAHILDPEGGERNGSVSVTPPARPCRRKHKPGTTTSSVTQNKATVKQETTATKLSETETINDRLDGDAETQESAKRNGNNNNEPETENAAVRGNKNSDCRLSSRVTDAEEADQTRTDSRLDTIEKIPQDDRLNGGSAEAETKRGSDSGSGGPGGEEEEVVVAGAGEGRGRGTISTREQPRACASPAANTNSPDDAAADVREKGSAQEESGNAAKGHTAGIKGDIRQRESKVVGKSEPMHNEARTEPLEAGKEKHQSSGDDDPPSRPASPPPDTDHPVFESEGRPGESPLGLTLKWDHYGKPDAREPVEAPGGEADTKVTFPPAAVGEAHIAPPRRRRKVSSSRSLQQEDAAIEPDTGQTLTRPIPPVRRKRQFLSLPRPPKTKLRPCDVSPSLSTSALALASTPERRAATPPLRPTSYPSTPAAESPVLPFILQRPNSSPPAAPATSTPTTSAAGSPAFPSTPIRPASSSAVPATSTPTTPATESPAPPSTPTRPASSPVVPSSSTPATPIAESPASTPTSSGVEIPNPPIQRNGVTSSRASRAKPAVKMDFESEAARRMSTGSTPEERKRRTLKKALRRTGSLKEMLYTQLQHRLDKNSRGEASDGLKTKYFPKIFHRKQKLYDMSCPSEHHSEIPMPAPPQQHLKSESTETFATLLSSYFPPDMEEQANADGETKNRYITFEHSPFDPPTNASKGKKTSLSENTSLPHAPLPASASDTETTAQLQEGNTNAGFLHDESDAKVKDSPLDGDSANTLSFQGASDAEKSILTSVIVEESPEEKDKKYDESCRQPPQEEPEPQKNTTEDTKEPTVDGKDAETTTLDDRLNGEATEPDADHFEDWQTQQRHHDLYASGENDAPGPSSPPPPPPPTDEEGHAEGLEESHEQEPARQAGAVWEPPHVSLRTWAERQGIKSLTLPPLRLRATRSPGLEEVDYYCDSDSSEERDTPSPGPPVDSEKEGRQGLLHKAKKEEDRTQKDRCVEVYPETVRQRQRNMMAANNKVDIQNWEASNNNNNESQSSPAKSKKFLPSVKALRNQFEAGKTPNGKTEVNGNVTPNGTNGHAPSRKSSSSATSTTQEPASTSPSTYSPTLNTPSASVESLGSPAEEVPESNEPVEPIFNQFRKVDQELRELMSKSHSTTGWDPRPLLKRLYYIPEAPKLQSQGTTYVNIEGYLEKLPSGRKKATFWNAWKRRYFMAKNGILYYYQNAQTDKPNMKMTLMGGKVECMEPNMVGVDDGSRDTKAPNMLGIDDGKGHYVVVRCSTRQEAERWRRALETHTVEDFASQYVQPWPIPTNPALLRDTLIVDIGSASVRAGVLASQATLPQVFIPSVVASGREGRGQVWGMDALAPDVRANSSLTFPIRPTHKITKYSVDLSAVSSLLQKTFADLKVDPKNYHLQLSVPRVLNTNTQAELLRVLFEKFGVRSVNLTHQSILALYAYNATSGIVVDIGERMDIVPVIDGYIVDGGVSRVPYGGYRILDHLRQFLYMRNVSLINEVESYIIRQVLENICYSAHHYNTEKARCTKNSDNFEKSVSLAEYFGTKDCPYESITLDFGRFQATEGLFNPDAWGLDHPGLHKLVHKAIMECSMDIRKEMSRSIFLAGGVTQLPGLNDRLTTELDNLTPPAIRPKVHASPYRYHAAYIGACVLAESPAFTQSRITQEDWNKHGNATLRKWSL